MHRTYVLNRRKDRENDEKLFLVFLLSHVYDKKRNILE